MRGRRVSVSRPADWLLGLALGVLAAGQALSSTPQAMTEILYEEKEAGQPGQVSRILIVGERLRMDYGRDEDDFVLFDGPAHTTWFVSRGDRRLIGIPAYPPGIAWPEGWTLSREDFPSGENSLTQVRVNGQLCLEFKSPPIPNPAARLLGDFRRALAGNQAKTWRATPEELRHPCVLAVDIWEAGGEYRQGLPLAVRYWDGRSRVYQGQQSREARPELFDLPSDYNRFVIAAPEEKPTAKAEAKTGAKAQGKTAGRKPATSRSR